MITTKTYWALKTDCGLFWVGKGPKVVDSFNFKTVPTWSTLQTGFSSKCYRKGTKWHNQEVTFKSVKIVITVDIEE